MIDDAARDDSGRKGIRGLLAAAVVLLGVSGWLLWTLVLEEEYLEPDRNAITEETLAIGLPALAGVLLVALAMWRFQRRPR
jgi:hypothetical protein